MEKKINKYIYWIPRILSILFLIFLSTFSLDVFSPKLSFWETIVGLFMHNIPVFILFIILMISWKYEIVGGIAFISRIVLYYNGISFSSMEISLALEFNDCKSSTSNRNLIYD